MDTDLVKPLSSLLTTPQPQGLYFATLLSGFFIAISGTQQKYKITVTTIQAHTLSPGCLLRETVSRLLQFYY